MVLYFLEGKKIFVAFSDTKWHNYRLLIAYYVSVTVSESVYLIIPHNIFIKNHYYSHFAEGKTESERGSKLPSVT